MITTERRSSRGTVATYYVFEQHSEAVES